MDLTERVIKTRVVFKGRYLTTEVRTVRMPDGQEAEREIVRPGNAVGILPIDEAGRVYLVRQYRLALGQATLEIPAGIMDEGEGMLETARRECEEEIGMTPGSLEHLFGFYHSVGFSTGRIEVVLARDLTPTHHVHHEHGEMIEVVILQFAELYRKVVAGEIVDSKTLTATLWHQQRLLTPPP